MIVNEPTARGLYLHDEIKDLGSILDMCEYQIYIRYLNRTRLDIYLSNTLGLSVRRVYQIQGSTFN